MHDESTEKLGLAIYAGGNHIFYVAGVLKYLFEHGLKYDALATYSAGGAILPLIVSNIFDEKIEVFKKLTDNNKQNFYGTHILSGRYPFPQDSIYKKTILKTLDVDDIRNCEKDIRVIVSTFRSTRFFAPLIAAISFIFLAFYGATKKYTKLHILRLFKYLFSIKNQVVSLNELSSKKEIVNYILGSSTIFPFIKLRKLKNEYMLDGKFSMLSPIGELRDCTHVLSIHAHGTVVPDRDNLYTLFPYEKVKAGPLDYAGSESFLSAYKQGYEEGAKHFSSIKDTPFIRK